MAARRTRRQFLASALGAAPLAGFFTHRAPPLPGSSRDRIVVVGAGLAGLAAAHRLSKAGQPVVVLEARPTAGGRVRTLRQPFDDGLHAEAGAIRIAARHRRVLQLVREHDLELVPFSAPTGASVVTLDGRSVRLPDGLPAIAGPLALTPDETGLTPAALLRRYVELPEALADPSTDVSTSRTWQAVDGVTWPEWLRSRGASPGAVTLMTLGGDSRRLSALYSPAADRAARYGHPVLQDRGGNGSAAGGRCRSAR